MLKVTQIAGAENIIVNSELCLKCLTIFFFLMEPFFAEIDKLSGRLIEK